MLKTKIGFIPSNWESWNGGNWAEKMRDRCVNVLNEIPGMELVVPQKDMTNIGCVSTVTEANKVLKYFKKENIQGLLIGNMTFGKEVAVSTILNGLSKEIPVLHFCTRSGPIDENGSRSTDNWCGQFMTASAIKRRGFKFIHINTCNPESNYFKEKIESFTRAVNAISRFKGARIGQIGTRPLLFESQNWCEQAMQNKFQQMVVPMDLDTFFTHIENVSKNDPQVKKIINELTERVDVSEETDDSLVNLARCEIAFKNVVNELNVQALAVRCWTRIQERFHISPCAILGRLNDQGIMAACEVDIYGALSMWSLYTAGLGETSPLFIDWTDLHPKKENIWLAWHCGNGSLSLCAKDSQPRLVRNERMIQWCPTCHGAMEYKLKSGPVTCARLVEYDGEFTMFFGKGEIIDIPPFVRGTYGWVKVNDVFDWENKMIENGIIHHGTLIHDHKVVDVLEMFCKFLGINAVRGD